MKIDTFLDVDVVAIETDDTVTVMLDVQAPEAVQDPSIPRPEHTAVVVLDRSGSMSGPRLDAAKRALISLVARLDDRDSFGLVTFDDKAQLVVPAGPVGVIGRDEITKRVAAIRTGGTTDLSSGYLRGLAEARRVAGPAGATVVVLSDGHANAGETDPAKLREMAAGSGAQTITTSTIGIGEGYDETLLAEIAVGGNGNHAFASDPDKAAAALAGEVEGLLSKTVQAATLMIRASSDVVTVSVVNELPVNPVAGGLLVELGDFYSGETRKLLLTFGVPAIGALGLAEIASLEMSYVELPVLVQHTVTLPITVNVVPGDQAAGRVANPQVHAERLFQDAQKAKRASQEALADQDIAGAQVALDQIIGSIASAPPAAMSEELAEELTWLRQTRDGLEGWDAAYSTKRMHSDRTRKNRGYKNRETGGER